MRNEVYLIDNMEYMRDLPDNAFALAIVDPPYGIGDFNQTASRKYHKKIEWNNSIPSPEYFKHLFRISKNQIIWGANYYPNLQGGRIIHDKLDGGRQCKGLSDCDIAYHSFGVNIKIFRYAWKGNVQGKTINWDNSGKDARAHPCQKPIALYEWLLKNYASPGQTIFDSHVGSGSIRIACHDMGFDFTGCELDPDYWQAQEDRYREHIKNKDIFSTEEYQNLIYEQGILE